MPNKGDIKSLGLGSKAPDHDQVQRDARETARDLEDFLDDLEVMSEDSRYNFAMDTIAGIHQTVERTRVVTDGQRRAIRNIRDGGENR